MMNMEKIGLFISKCRKSNGLTQFELGDKLGITDRAVSKWERGKGLPDASLMLQLCDVLGITVNELLSGKRIKMENNEKKTQELLAQMAEKEYRQNKKMMFYEFVIGISATVSFLIMMAIAAFLLEPGIKQIAVIIAGLLVLLVGVFFALKIETETGFYQCKKCGHKYVPKYTSVVFAMHNGTTRYLKCPECHKRSWNKKVLK